MMMGQLGTGRQLHTKIPDDCEADIARQDRTLRPRFLFIIATLSNKHLNPLT